MSHTPYTLAEWRPRAGAENDFIAAWEELAGTFSTLEAPPLWGTLLRSESDPGLFYSFGPWRAAEDIAAMRANPAAQSALAAVRALCEIAAPGGYREVAHVKVPQTIDAVYPYLHVRGGPAAIEFYRRVFGATEVARITSDDGRVAHAELHLGAALIMLADEHPEFGIASPQSFGGSGTTLHMHVRDVDAMTERARQAGATILREPADQPHGERQSRLRDPFGHEWLLGQESAAR